MNKFYGGYSSHTKENLPDILEVDFSSDSERVNYRSKLKSFSDASASEVSFSNPKQFNFDMLEERLSGRSTNAGMADSSKPSTPEIILELNELLSKLKKLNENMEQNKLNQNTPKTKSFELGKTDTIIEENEKKLDKCKCIHKCSIF